MVEQMNNPAPEQPPAQPPAEPKPDESKKKSDDESKKPSRWSRFGKPAVAAGGGFVAGVATGAYHGGKSYVARGDEEVGPVFLLFVFGAMFIFIVDYSLNFWRGDNFYTVLFPIWLAYSFLLFWWLRNHPSLVHDSPGGFVMLRLSLGVLLPYIIVFLKNTLVFSGNQQMAFLSMVVAFNYFAPIMIFMLGFPFWTLMTAGRMPYLGVLFRIVSYTIVILLVLLALLPVGNTLRGYASTGGGVVVDNLPTMREMVSDTWSLLHNWSDRTVGVATGRIDTVTEQFYVGQVEQSQGRPLGVRFAAITPTMQSFNYVRETSEDGVVGDIVLGTDKQVTWFGDLRARTLGYEPQWRMNINLYCEYLHDVKGVDNASLPASHARVSVFYSGDHDDVFSFFCSIPMGSEVDAQNHIPYSSREGRSGRFQTRAHFTFWTWGFTTMTFMERDLGLALRREGRDPATFLGIAPTGRALYTPGPVMLGMEIARQPMLITTVRSDADSNYLPAFGITISNGWASQSGNVPRVHELILQVPEPL